MSWEDETHWEKEWHGTCQNSFGEEEKQLVYAQKMGLRMFHNGKSPYNFDFHGEAVLDIGGGPYSLLLKSHNVKAQTVVDPCDYPEWVALRYQTAGITYLKQKAEDITLTGFDTILIYNVLQHVDNPEKIIRNAQKAGKLIRIFEWIDHGTSQGHPHDLKELKLNQWLKGEGKVEVLDLPQLRGKAYYGVFPT